MNVEDTPPPAWALIEANMIADCAVPRPCEAIVRLIAGSLALAYVRGERRAYEDARDTFQQAAE